MDDLISKIKSLADKYFEEIRDIRRHMHSHPELSFQEYKTSEYISAKLRDWGLNDQKSYVRTGIGLKIQGERQNDKTIALRADMDALPIHEMNDVSYKSQNDGVMHACGHDVHTASLLGAVKILNELKSEWGGNVFCIFQPGEEKLPGGAKLMIEEGILNDAMASGIIGQHVYPELESGQVGLRSGAYMASTDELYIKVIGKGGHGALPHKTIDPVLISAHLIVSLQQIISRTIPANVPAVLSFGKIEGKGATNIIPDFVTIEGTFRTMDEAWRKKAHEKIIEMATNLCTSMGAKCEIEILKGYPVLHNNSELTSFVRKTAIEFLGVENVKELDKRMTAEDFAYYSQEIPASFYRLGTANTKEGLNVPVHNPKFNIDESALKTGMGLMAYLAITELNN